MALAGLVILKIERIVSLGALVNLIVPAALGIEVIVWWLLFRKPSRLLAAFLVVFFTLATAHSYVLSVFDCGCLGRLTKDQHLVGLVASALGVVSLLYYRALTAWMDDDGDVQPES